MPIKKQKQSHPPHEKNDPTSWGPVSSWYDAHLSGEDTYHEKVLLPNILRLVVPEPGDTILDLACGQGYLSGPLLEKGAVVVGIDISSELITLARAHHPNGSFFVSHAEDLSVIGAGSMSKCLISLAAQNIKDFDHVVKEVTRVLRPSGSFTIVLNHPAFRSPGQSSWGNDEKTKTQYRRMDSYLSEKTTEILMHPSEPDGEKTISFHRPLQWYAKHLFNNGFTIDRLEEWTSHRTSVGKHAREENRARKEFPLFLALRAIKIS